jgi:pilus assembly protein CpaF
MNSLAEDRMQRLAETDFSAADVSTPQFLGCVRTLHERLLAALDLRRTGVERISGEDLRRMATTALSRIVREWPEPLPASTDALISFVLDEALGLGPLELLLADESITEIMVNAPDTIFVERHGRVSRVASRFSSDQALRGVIERIVAPLGRRIDEAAPMVDARLPDGSRVNIVIPPLAIGAAAVTIRRFGRHRLVAHDLIRLGSLSTEMLEFLQMCIEQRRNLIVSGGTGSGKTTLLNILSALINRSERIVTLEDSAELALDHPNRVVLEARLKNLEGRGEVTIRDLLRNALRMRPDRIIVGECRGGEALDMLQAMNTGHDGSLTTVHANSPRDALARLEVMALMAGLDLPLQAIREQIASAVHLVVQQQRFRCGTRRITEIAEVAGMEGGRIQMQTLFRFVQTGHGGRGEATPGYFTGCGTLPGFFEALRGRGLAPQLEWFEERHA